jgi:hypothetical protein
VDRDVARGIARSDQEPVATDGHAGSRVGHELERHDRVDLGQRDGSDPPERLVHDGERRLDRQQPRLVTRRQLGMTGRGADVHLQPAQQLLPAARAPGAARVRVSPVLEGVAVPREVGEAEHLGPADDQAERVLVELAAVPLRLGPRCHVKHAADAHEQVGIGAVHDRSGSAQLCDPHVRR